MNGEYRHSGVIPLAGAIVTPAVGVLGALVLAVPYSYGITKIPLIYFNFFVVAIYGASIGYAVVWSAWRTKVRSAWYPIVCALLAASAGYYAAWGADFLLRDAVPAPADPLSAWHPELLKNYILIFYEHGFWKLTNGPEKGGFLLLIWFLEFSTIVILAYTAVRIEINDRTFCERCETWSKLREGLAKYALGDHDDDIALRLQRREFHILAGRRLPAETDPVSLELAAHICPVCNEHCYVTFQKEFSKSEANGGRTRWKEPIVDRLAVDGATLRMLLAGAPKQ